VAVATASQSPRTRTLPGRLTLELNEPCWAMEQAPGELRTRIDREQNVLKGVRLVGSRSNNEARVIGLTENEVGDAAGRPYRYCMEGLGRSKHLYEGAKVFNDHLPFDYDRDGRRVVKSAVRDNDKLLGWIRNVRVAKTGNPDVDGLYGDFHYLASHPFTPRLLEIAERNPTALAMSHEAIFDQPRIEGGQVVLPVITEVHAIALVSNRPGTTTGLFESSAKERQMPLTIRKVLESAPRNVPGYSLLKRCVFEMDEAPEETPDDPLADTVISEEAPGEMDPQQQVRMGLLAAVNKKLDEADTSQLKAVLKALGLSDSVSENVAGPPPEELTAEEEGGDGEELAAEQEGEEEMAAEEEGEDKPAAAEMGYEDNPVAEEEGEDKAEAAMECADLLAAAGIPTKRVLIESMVALPKAKRKQFVSELASSRPNPMGTPRSAAVKPQPKARPAWEVAEEKYGKKGAFVAEQVGRNSYPIIPGM